MVGVLIILLLQLIYVPLHTLRTIMVVKGNTKYAVIIGFFDSLINITAITIILTGDMNVLEIAVYALGFSLGILSGSLLEKKLAIGYRMASIYTASFDSKLPNILRKNNFGVTTLLGEGRNGKRLKLEVVLKRSDTKKLEDLVKRKEPNAFLAISEIVSFNGGHIVERLKEKELPK